MDVLGAAIKKFWETGNEDPVIVHISGKRDGDMSPAVFFRAFKKMKKIEKEALRQCRGKVLDVGAGAGCHSLLLQERGFDITALEKSPLAAEVMVSRGVNKVHCGDILNYHTRSYDTILLLMNGLGIAGDIDHLSQLLVHLETLLLPGGQIITDSTDIFYLSEKKAEASEIDFSKAYYGEVEFSLAYEGMSTAFPWIYADEVLLEELCEKAGLKMTMIARGLESDFLVRIECQQKF